MTRPPLLHLCLFPALHSACTVYPRINTTDFCTPVTHTPTELQSSISAEVLAPGLSRVAITLDDQYQWEARDNGREAGNSTRVARWMRHLTHVIACPPRPPPTAVLRSGRESIAGVVGVQDISTVTETTISLKNCSHLPLGSLRPDVPLPDCLDSPSWSIALHTSSVCCDDVPFIEHPATIYVSVQFPFCGPQQWSKPAPLPHEGAHVVLNLSSRPPLPQSQGPVTVQRF